MFVANFINRALIVCSNKPALLKTNVPSFRFVDSNVKYSSLSLPLRKEKGPDSEKEPDERISSKDRTKEIPVGTSIRYLNSSAYASTYGEDPIWKNYRRNHKGAIPPKKTRKTCVRGGQITTGNPCPICRDEYLVLQAENVELLKQFISPYNGETLSYKITGLCQKKHKDLLVAIEVAKDRGLITYDVPFREYDYTEYNVKS